MWLERSVLWQWCMGGCYHTLLSKQQGQNIGHTHDDAQAQYRLWDNLSCIQTGFILCGFIVRCTVNTWCKIMSVAMNQECLLPETEEWCNIKRREAQSTVPFENVVVTERYNGSVPDSVAFMKRGNQISSAALIASSVFGSAWNHSTTTKMCMRADKRQFINMDVPLTLNVIVLTINICKNLYYFSAGSRGGTKPLFFRHSGLKSSYKSRQTSPQPI